MPQSSLQGRGGFTRSTASRRRAPEICDFGPGPGGGFTACPVTVRSPRRPRRRWHPMPNHVANPSPRLRPIKGRCISVYRLPQRRHSPSARCPTARRWHRASDRWRGCICRDRLPQGCGSRAYRDVFTACPGGYNPSSDRAPHLNGAGCVTRVVITVGMNADPQGLALVGTHADLRRRPGPLRQR